VGHRRQTGRPQVEIGACANPPASGKMKFVRLLLMTSFIYIPKDDKAVYPRFESPMMTALAARAHRAAFHLEYTAST
jgi:hypothetical protein